jgi:hypothetical protein
VRVLPGLEIPMRAAAPQLRRQRGHLSDLDEAVTPRPEVPLAQAGTGQQRFHKGEIAIEAVKYVLPRPHRAREP